MSYQNIIVSTRDRIATITLDRPKVLNALNWQTMQEIRSALSKVRDDESVGGVILTGNGEKAFAAGADIKELTALTSVGAKSFSVASQDILRLIERFPKPVIAAVNGYCLGGGCELAMACHMRVAADSSKFGQPEVSLGIMPGNGGTQRLPRLIGKGRAMQLILSGDTIDAQEAYRIGLVNKVVALQDLLSATQQLMQTIIKKAPIAITLCLEAVNHGLEMTLEEGIQLEANLFGVCFSTEDAKEGTRAFIEKRPPNFKGK